MPSPHGCPREPVPETVVVTDSPRQPEERSDLGIPVAVAAAGTPRNRLVAIGDSLTHGFQSGAIFNTDLSYPALIAAELGWLDQFRRPQYPGFGGIPLNIEALLRDLENRFGDRLSWWELPGAAFAARQRLAEAEEWWDRGPGSRVPPMPGIAHNLGIYGWDLRDVLERTADTAREEERVPDDWRLVPLVRNADSIAARRVLESARGPDGTALTPLRAAHALGEEGTLETGTGHGIETLIVALGANNALGSVIGLCVRWSDDGFDDLRAKARFNVWRPEHFAAELDLVVAQLRDVAARHVILLTVPHVTIAPVARGVGGKVAPGSRYFRDYTRPWIADRDFDRRRDPYLTSDEARAIDSVIDQYNEAIAGHVRRAREQGRDWRLLDLAGLLDRLATRRYLADPAVHLPEWWTPYVLPDELLALSPPPDTRFMASGPSGRTAGGLFSLDGVHPTTIAYGLMAQELIRVMRDAGVVFFHPDGVTPRQDPVQIDWRALLGRDSLLAHPLASLTGDVALLGWLDERLDILGRLWSGLTGG